MMSLLHDITNPAQTPATPPPAVSLYDWRDGFFRLSHLILFWLLCYFHFLVSFLFAYSQKPKGWIWWLVTEVPIIFMAPHAIYGRVDQIFTYQPVWYHSPQCPFWRIALNFLQHKKCWKLISTEKEEMSRFSRHVCPLFVRPFLSHIQTVPQNGNQGTLYGSMA